jgi:hypothetical protein
MTLGPKPRPTKVTRQKTAVDDDDDDKVVTMTSSGC